MSGLAEFRIEVEKRVYYPNEVVRGKLYLLANTPITCRSISVQLQHQASVHWHTLAQSTGVQADGKPHLVQKSYSNAQDYVMERRSLWGNVFHTSALWGVGHHAIFNSPTAPTAGWVDIPLSAAAGSLVALRVVNHDFGFIQLTLGECTIDVDKLLALGGAAAELPLFIDSGCFGGYQQQRGLNGPSVAWVSAVPSAAHDGDDATDSAWRQGEARRVCVRVHAALHLRPGEMMFGAQGDDVICQLFELPAGTRPAAPDTPLPQPPGPATLPVGARLVVPFAFKLPANLPSSLEGVPELESGFVRCSLYSHVHHNWLSDPSTRELITIVQPVPAGLPRFLQPLAMSEELPTYEVACCLGIDCPMLSFMYCEDTSLPKGVAALSAALPRVAWAPGELMPLSLTLCNPSIGARERCPSRLNVAAARDSATASLRDARTGVAQVSARLERTFIVVASGTTRTLTTEIPVRATNSSASDRPWAAARAELRRRTPQVGSFSVPPEASPGLGAPSRSCVKVFRMPCLAPDFHGLAPADGTVALPAGPDAALEGLGLSSVSCAPLTAVGRARAATELRPGDPRRNRGFVDPLRWHTQLVVDISVPEYDAKGQREGVAALTCNLPIFVSALPLPPQQQAAAPQRDASPQEVTAPTFANGRAKQLISAAELATAAAAAGAPPPLQASGAAVDVAHEKEDAGAVDRTVLKYAPQYFVAPTQAEPPPFEQQT